MDNSSVTDEDLQEMYQKPVVTATGTFSAQEVEKEIQAGKWVTEEQFSVFNDYQTVKRQRGNLQNTQGQQQQTVPLQTQENTGFWGWIKNKFSSLFSKKSAQGSPTQAQKPAKNTVKWEDSNQIRDRIAGSFNSRADHVSYEMVRQINDCANMRDNAKHEAEKYIDEAKEKKIPLRPVASKDLTRVVWGCFQGYRKNREGKPATEEDEKRRDVEFQWIRDYFSTDEDRHNSAIDKVVDDLLEVKFTPAMLKDSYVDSHMGELNDIVLKMNGFSDIGTANKDYFKHMDPIKAELLEARFFNFRYLFGQKFLLRLAEKGVEQTGKYLSEERRIDKEEEKGITKSNLKNEEEKDWFSKREQTEKLVANLEKSRNKEEEKIREQTQQGLEERRLKLAEGFSREDGFNMCDLGFYFGGVKDFTPLSSSVSTMEEIKVMMDGHRQEYWDNCRLIRLCLAGIGRELNLCDESELKARSYAAVGSKLDQIKSRKKLSPEQEKMGRLASDKVGFELRQIDFHRSKSLTYRKGIDAILTGEKPSEEFWDLLNNDYFKRAYEDYCNKYFERHYENFYKEPSEGFFETEINALYGQSLTDALKDRWGNRGNE